MNRTKYLFKNTLLFAIGSIGTKFISFFMVPLYTYALTSAQYGTVDLCLTISMLLTPFVSLNIHESIMRYCLDRDSDKSAIVSTGFAILFVGAILSLIMIPVLYLLPTLRQYAVLIYLIILGGVLVNVGQAFLKGIEKINLYVISSVVNVFLSA